MNRISSFTVCLTMVILMIIGAALVPLVDVGIKPPPRQGKTITVSFSWPGASAKVVEHGATSVIEGLAAGVRGVENISSESFFGRGRVRIELKKNADVSAVRFEMASLLRQVYSRLPEGVGYPQLSGGEVVNNTDRKNKPAVLLTYNINADMSEADICRYVEQTFADRLRRIDGVKEVSVTGPADTYIEMSYDPRLLAAYGISTDDIARAIEHFTGREDIVGDVMRPAAGGGKVRQTLAIATRRVLLADIPLTTSAGHTVYLNNLVEMQERKREPDRYYRINGQNTVNMTVSVAADDNFIAMSDMLQREVEAISARAGGRAGLTLAHDAAEEERVEVFNLVSRSLASLLILLFCVWIVRRNGRYLFIIAATLTANVLVAVIFYWLADLRLHIFSMAGITVSLGLIIDSSIVMADHYGYYHNRKAFLAILAAMLTTIGSLSAVFFLPESWQEDLYDFARIIIINLIVSLLVALLFVPALTDSLRYSSRRQSARGHARFIVRISRFYRWYVGLIRRHRLIGVSVIVLAFGIPFFALPPAIETDTPGAPGTPADSKPAWYASLYNSTIGNSFVWSNIVEPLQAVTGGTLKLFVDALDERRRDDGDEKPVLTIRGRMPVGGTAAELNRKVVIIDNLLKAQQGIKCFTTSINGRGATVKVEFDDSCAFTSLPYIVENRVIDCVISIGGADWSTYGVRPIGFSNSLNLQYRSHRIWVSGYNFDRLSRYADDICRYMGRNSRVRDVMVEVGESFGYDSDDATTELFMDYNHELMALYGITAAEVHSALANLLQQRRMGRYDNGTGRKDVYIRSEQTDRFDRWQLLNSYVDIGGRNILVSDLMEVRERDTRHSIPRKNQEYVLSVAFNVLGSYVYTSDYIDEVVSHFSATLPMGFKCTRAHYSYKDDRTAPYWIIGIVVLVIFFVCAVLFESLSVPLLIISLIPMSFIGLFVTFWATGVPFGTGGFASMVMLAGIVVNSGIYIINEYRLLRRAAGGRRLSVERAYVKAYNHKVVAVMLTIFSTVLGLVPFFFDHATGSFWLSFATGVTGGLLFSVVAIVFAMPMFLGKK